MNESLKAKEIKELIDDYNKCDFYLQNLNNGNIIYLNEAIEFSNRKYKEFVVKNKEVALMNTSLFPTNLDSLSQTKQNLVAIEKMIDEIIIKENNN